MDPHPQTPGDPHSHTPAPTGSPEEQARRAQLQRIAMKKARRRERKKLLRQEAGSLELEQGPSELQKEDPQVRQIPLGWLFATPPAALAMDSDGDPHPDTPGDPHSMLHPRTPAPTNLPMEQARLVRKAVKKERKQELKKLRQEAVALERPSQPQKEDLGTPQVRQITPGLLSPPPALITGSPETRGPDSLDMEEYLFQRIGESLEPAPARLRHSFLYSDRPRRFRRPRSIEEHVGEVSTREFQALTLDQSPPTPDSTNRIEKHDSKLEAHTLRQSPPTLHSTPSIEDYASEVRALKLARSPPTLDSTHSETGTEIVEEKPQNESVPRAQRYIYFDFVELLIAHEHGFSDPVQHKLDAEAYWAAGEETEAPKVSESLASLTEKLQQGKSSTKEIIENGKKWMGEEVMLAFEDYIEGKTQFKDVSYCLGEIQQQCFSVESYNHIFHHFNFTVKTKKSSEIQWSSKLYFAEVKEVYGRKYYFCYELDSYDDGHCYACTNQGMHALQHPICEIGYQGGNAAMGAPFVYISDDDW